MRTRTYPGLGHVEEFEMKPTLTPIPTVTQFDTPEPFAPSVTFTEKATRFMTYTHQEYTNRPARRTESPTSDSESNDSVLVPSVASTELPIKISSTRAAVDKNPCASLSPTAPANVHDRYAKTLHYLCETLKSLSKASTGKPTVTSFLESDTIRDLKQLSHKPK